VKTLCALVLLAVASPALADRVPVPQPPQTQVHLLVNLACNSTNDDAKFKALLAPDAFVEYLGMLDVKSDLQNLKDLDLTIPQDVSVTLAADQRAAWFQTVCPGVVDKKAATHVAGLSTLQPDHTWKLEAVSFVVGETDAHKIDAWKKPLYAGWGMPTEKELLSSGDESLNSAIVGWIRKTALAKAAGPGTVFAAGTAPAELGAGKDALALAAKWDKLKLGIGQVRSRILPSGYGVAFVDTRWKYKTEVVGLDLMVVAVKDGDTWKWVSLSFD
jgi:hypothetical protein